ncbi:MAG: zinc ribbon domain-containing protein [Polyangia bacterium]
MEPCRKCGTPNPPSNQYCRKCGAVLSVSTGMVRAQPRTLIPLRRGFRWRWVALGALAILGATALSFAALVAVVVLALGRRIDGSSLGEIGSRAPGLAATALGVLLAAFAIGGMITSRMSRLRRVGESALAALCVLGFLAAVGTTLSSDAALVAAVMALPCAAAAGLGGRLGATSEKESRVT